MTTPQRPIFPPDEANYSPEMIEASRAQLDQETVDLLDLDRARLNQTTAMAALALGECLGLSEDTTRELSEKLNQRLNDMSPAYHQYVGLLISSVPVAVNNQEGTTSPRLQAASTSTEVQPKLPDPQSALDGQLSNGHSPDAAIPKPDQANEGSGQELQILPDYDPADLLDLPEGFTVIEYEQPISSLKNFVTDIFPGKNSDIEELSAVELALVGHQLVKTYMQTKIPQASESRKAKQKERMESLFGFKGPYENIAEICQKLNISYASFNQGLKAVKTVLARIVNSDFEDIAKRARVTAKHGELELISPDQYQEQPPEPETKSSLYDLIENLPPLHEHYNGTPVNMRNFLYEVFSSDYGSALTELSTKEAGTLVQLILNEFEALPGTKLTPEVRQERVLYIERWAGLYGNPREYSEIARARNKTTTQVSSAISSSITKINSLLSEKELKEMLDVVRDVTRRPPESLITA